MSKEEEPPLLHAFAGYGIELEYMIVDREHLSVQPIADQLLRNASGTPCGNVSRGDFGWSNELVMHVIEIKNLRPSVSLHPLADAFQQEVRVINHRLESHGAQLMPAAMHPWMDPRQDTRLWPHDNEAIYQAYDRIFDSRTHGWSNLQSMHLNLPFASDEEFERLHAAIRMVLPILPALAASSPIADGRITGWANYRMQAYCGNSQQIPSIAGLVIPETVTSRQAYEQQILAPMYHDIAPYDPQQVLQQEWLNSRGAIARFDRHAIEIRVLDTQECPRADLAIAAAVTALVRRLYHVDAPTLVLLQEMATTSLAAVLQACIRDGGEATISDPAYLGLLRYPGKQCSASTLWRHLVTGLASEDAGHLAHWQPELHTILEYGCLSRRILQALGPNPTLENLRSVYGQLCDCLQQGTMFVPNTSGHPTTCP